MTLLFALLLIVVPEGTACQVPSPLKQLDELAVPVPSLAVATVPDPKLEAFNDVNEAPEPLKPVEVNKPVEGL